MKSPQNSFDESAPKDFRALLQEAVRNHQESNFTRARRLYEDLLALDPDHPDVLNLFGLLLHAEGDHGAATGMIEKAVSQMPGNPHFRNNLGSVYAADGKPEKAIEHFRKAVELDPAMTLAHRNLGNALLAIGKPGEATRAYRKVIETEPDFETAYLDLANALSANGKPKEAVACLQGALGQHGDFAVAHNNLGTLLQELGRNEEAIESYRNAIAVKPNYAAAHANLASVLLEQKFLDEGEKHAKQALALNPHLQMAHTALGLIRLARGEIAAAAETIAKSSRRFRALGADGGSGDATFEQINKFKIEQDLDQLEYLRKKGVLGADGEALIREYRKLSSLVPPDGTIVRLADLDVPLSDSFLRSYNRALNLYEAPVIEEGVINAALDTDAIEEAYHNRSPGFACVDDFLMPAAMESLRRFCLESTIWHDISAVGDLGASLEEGFCCPLLLQIAHEIRERFPSIYGEHYFSTCWSYRYYAMKSGDDLHGDSGRVSVNIWLTPDEANKAPGEGGLLFWNKKVPMLEVKDNPKDVTHRIMRDIISEPDAESFSVPYKFNRATLFNSNTIHKTDALDFKAGYLNRRMNITFVFGKPEY